MKTIEIIFADAGGGHRAATNALCEIARRQERPWTMRVTNIADVFAGLDPIQKVTGTGIGETYNEMLRRGWTLGTPILLRALHATIRLYHDVQVTALSHHWQHEQPDLVVSIIPQFNRAIYEAVQRVMPRVPLVSILTDLADYPPHFWIEEGQRQYFICGTERARDQAFAAGHPAERVFLTSGMILHPRFYEPLAEERDRRRAELGLDAALPTALMMFGGEGSRAMPGIVRQLDESGLNLQVIAICGQNARLEATMRALPLRIRMHVVGFTTDMPRLMGMADFFIGKPGPGSISEALVKGLPVIIERNARTLPQERYNAVWVREHGFGIPVHSFRRDIVEAAREMLDPERRREFAASIKGYRNRAVFEIPEILEKLLA